MRTKKYATNFSQVSSLIIITSELYNQRGFKACEARKTAVYYGVNEDLRASITQKTPD